MEIVFFISSNTFLGVVKLYVFRKKILGTLGDALRPILLCGIVEGIFLTHLGIRFRKEPGRSRTIGCTDQVHGRWDDDERSQ